MGVKCSSSNQVVTSYFESVKRIIEEEMVKGLSNLGEQCVTRIRDRTPEESWKDRSGNLRGSIGYAVSDHGKSVIESAFKQVLKGTEGPIEGRKLVEELTKLYTDTYALIVVAGMNYAEEVEKIKSKDVLASTELWAKNKIDNYMKRIVNKIARKVKRLKL